MNPVHWSWGGLRRARIVPVHAQIGAPLLDLREKGVGVDFEILTNRSQSIANRRGRQHQLTEQAGAARWKNLTVVQAEAVIARPLRRKVEHACDGGEWNGLLSVHDLLRIEISFGE